MNVAETLASARNSDKIRTLTDEQADGAEAYFQAFEHVADTYGDSPVELQRVAAWMYLEQTASPGFSNEAAEEQYMIGMEIGRTVLSHLQ